MPAGMVCRENGFLLDERELLVNELESKQDLLLCQHAYQANCLSILPVLPRYTMSHT